MRTEHYKTYSLQVNFFIVLVQKIPSSTITPTETHKSSTTPTTSSSKKEKENENQTMAPLSKFF